MSMDNWFGDKSCSCSHGNALVCAEERGEPEETACSCRCHEDAVAYNIPSHGLDEVVCKVCAGDGPIFYGAIHAECADGRCCSECGEAIR